MAETRLAVPLLRRRRDIQRQRDGPARSPKQKQSDQQDVMSLMMLVQAEKQMSMWQLWKSQSQHEMDLQVLAMLSVELQFVRQRLIEARPAKIMCCLQQFFTSFKDTTGIVQKVLDGFHKEVDEVFDPAPTALDLEDLWEMLDRLKANKFKNFLIPQWADVKRWGVRAAMESWREWPGLEAENKEGMIEEQSKLIKENEGEFISWLTGCFQQLQEMPFVSACPMLSWFVRGLTTAAKAGNYDFMSSPILCLTGIHRESVFGFLGDRVPWLAVGYVLDDLLNKGLVDEKHFAPCDSAFAKLQTGVSQTICMEVARLHGAMNANKLYLAEAKSRALAGALTAALSLVSLARPLVVQAALHEFGNTAFNSSAQ